MSVATPLAPARESDSLAPEATTALTHRRSGPRHLTPGWPLAALFMAYPLWWVLGLGELAGLVAAGIMLVELVRRQRILAPRGFGSWLLFLCWMVAGVAVMQVNAPGTVPGHSNNRYAVWGFRVVWFLAATIVLLYVGNLRRDLSTLRVTRMLSWMFVVVVAGGFLGTLVPHLDFPSLLELVLPSGVRSIPFLETQIHPQVAQVGGVLGYESGRPSAPFAYANEWGLNFAVFLPFFVSAWCRRDAGWRRIAAPFVLMAAVVPVVFSLNRGLWLSLCVMAAFLAIRSALTGKVRLIVALMVGMAVVGGIVVVSPLGTRIQTRFEMPNSNEGRTELDTLAVTSTANRSPVIGFGSTRNVQGTFTSIAGGATAKCPTCSPPAVGTQGLLWLVTFSTGLVGVVLFLLFFLRIFLGNLRLRSPAATMSLTVLVAFFVTLPVYDFSGPAIFGVMVAVALLWRESVTARARTGLGRLVSNGEPTFGGYLTHVRRHAAIIAVCMLLGGMAGGAYEVVRGVPVSATVPVLLPIARTDPGSIAPSLDTEARFASNPAVLSAVSVAVGRTVAAHDTAISMSAIPNTRILEFTYTARSVAAARAGATAGANALIQLRAQNLLSAQDSTLKNDKTQLDGLSTAIQTVETAIAGLDAKGVSARDSRVRALRDTKTRLLRETSHLNLQVGNIASNPLSSGRVLGSAVVQKAGSRIKVAVASGLMLGFLAGVLLGLGRDAISRRMSRRIDVREETGLQVIADVPKIALAPGTHGVWGSAETAGAARAVQLFGASTCVSVDGDPLACRLAARLSQAATQADQDRQTRDGGPVTHRRGLGTDRRVVLVARRRTRVRTVIRAREGLEASGLTVAGIVLVTGR